MVKGKQRYLNVCAGFIVDMCRIATIKHVADFLGVGWDLVKAIFKAHLTRRLKRRSLRKVRNIAIDEFAIQKGHKYMTVVLDLDTGAVLSAEKGRDAESLLPFLRRLKYAKAPLKAVAMDMWPAYLLAVQTVFPRVTIVHDPFHIVAMVNRAIDEIRRSLSRTVNKDDRRFIKGSRFILLKARERLEENGLRRLALLTKLNRPLYRAYLLKEDLRQFWHLTSTDEAGLFLSRWITQAKALHLAPFTRIAKTLAAHAQFLLSWFKHRISTGPLEGLNNKIKVLKRQAYGFRDIEYFKLRLYFIHESTPAFSG
jgi:transposase